MIINYLTNYLLSEIIHNEYFAGKSDITNEEVISKSGIKQRKHLYPFENTNSMAIEEVKKACFNLPFSIHKMI